MALNRLINVMTKNNYMFVFFTSSKDLFFIFKYSAIFKLIRYSY